jgi:hypothetical protein
VQIKAQLKGVVKVAKEMDALKKQVEKSEYGVVLTNGEALRKAAGITRLKEKARKEVAASLAREMLLAIPRVPRYQHEPVYVANLGSDAALLFVALNDPTEQSMRTVEVAAGRVMDAPTLSPLVLDELEDALDEAKDSLDELREELEQD